MTAAERHIWEILRQRQLGGWKFRRQQPLGPYIADFYCAEARLVIEVDGGQHGTQGDAERDAWMRAQGLEVLRFWNNEVLQNTDGVYRRIEAALGKKRPPVGRVSGAVDAEASGHPHPNPSPVKGEGLEADEMKGDGGSSVGGVRETRSQLPERDVWSKSKKTALHTSYASLAAPAGEMRAESSEMRLYGFNAVQAMFARRPQALRKLYLAEARIPQLQPLLKWCVAHRIGYRVVAEDDLRKLAASAHHEGVVADVLREEPLALAAWLRALPAAPQCALWLDGVGNPHNLGAILRSAAHFGVAAILLPGGSSLALSGAAARVAEGGAEAVPFVRMGGDAEAVAQLRGAGFGLAATVVRGGDSVFAAALPQRLVYVLGAEGEGMSPALAAYCDLRLSIPGSGAVESLNVASACAVLLAAWRSRSAPS